jgi:hypothetical protein
MLINPTALGYRELNAWERLKIDYATSTDWGRHIDRCAGSTAAYHLGEFRMERQVERFAIFAQ